MYKRQEWWQDIDAKAKSSKIEHYLEGVELEDRLRLQARDIVLYNHDLVKPLEWVEDKQADMAIVVPFKGGELETKTIPGVIKTIAEGVKRYYPRKKAVILAVAGPYDSNQNEGSTLKAAQETIEAVRDENIDGYAFAMVNKGKGWGMAATLEMIDKLKSPFIFLDADLRQTRIYREEGRTYFRSTPPWRDDARAVSYTHLTLPTKA